MAQDSSAPQNVKPEVVNLDDLEVSILVLAKNPASIKATAAFLTRRGWPTHVLTSISAVVEYVAEKKPDFVLVSFNHQNPAVLKLPELLSQTFNVTCVGFVENGDAASAQKLNQLRIKHKIFGQPSGPNFHRGIRRILADQFDVKLEERTNDETAREKGAVTIRGGAKPVDAHGVVQMGAASSEMVTRAGETGSLEKSAAQELGGVKTSGSTSAEVDSFGGVTSAASVESTPAAPTPAAYASASAYDAVPEEANSNSFTNGKYTMGSKRKSLKEMMRGTHGAEAGAAVHAANGASGATSDGGGQAELLGKLKQSLFGDSGEDASELATTSVLERAVDGAFEQVCDTAQNIDPIPIRDVQRLAVFPVDSTTSAGYLVMAFAGERSDEQKAFLKVVEESLQRNFAQMKVPAKIENGFWLDFPEISFDDWVATVATFTFKMSHNGGELGVAFFQTNKPLPKPRATEKGMHIIDIDDISTDQPVNFKAYLHFKKNQKYFLYLRNGRRLQPEQKDRLKGHQVKDLFMKSVDLENLRIFLASTYLRATIPTAS